MSPPFETVDVGLWSVVADESTGGDEKSWREDPNGVAWLFKPRTDHGNWSQGEDWAEKIASEVAHLIGVPAARVELANLAGQHGSISRSLRPDTWELQHGAVLLAGHLLDYQPRTRGRTGHTLDNIATLLSEVGPPDDVPDLSAFDAFAGYLVLDALVANQDRHEENWAVLRSLQGETVLAGSYDHGSSLGFNLTDSKRTRELDRDGVQQFARRARAQRFDGADEGRLSLVSLARRALLRCSPATQAHWRSQLNRVGDETLCSVVDRVPGLSDPVTSFARALLTTNRRRLLDDC